VAFHSRSIALEANRRWITARLTSPSIPATTTSYPRAPPRHGFAPVGWPNRRPRSRVQSHQMCRCATRRRNATGRHRRSGRRAPSVGSCSWWRPRPSSTVTT
jgi:hypothetical protein